MTTEGRARFLHFSLETHFLNIDDVLMADDFEHLALMGLVTE